MSAQQFRKSAALLNLLASNYEGHAQMARGAHEEQGWTDLEYGLSQLAAQAEAIACVIEERDGMRLPFSKFVPACPAERRA